ncbi:hypothetical protein KFL_005500040 [Klebsormidium nitens]|uniref:Uncharacterized protein n=1 Tax=Klebsormidium nitens TaxID=105231 RepID=A0A1Y1IKK2_KLENI|nr:hypothetical protein KFL_005500040 [Klebsormidium nitens]|eukprot:GAQ89681.1 hypothetical protein KFL_005500040 [Klebsormidium nitens]
MDVPDAIALVRGVPDSFSEALTLHEKPEAIDVAKAKQQHAAYVEQLKRLVPRVVEIAPDNRYPDCCFIEDTAVVRGNSALITRPGNIARQGEVTAVREKLQELGVQTTDTEPDATIDGGDVLQTRTHIFVGLSSRTNEAGVDALRKAFPDTPVVLLPVPSGLHLKSGLSWVGPNTLAVEDSPEVLDIFKRIKKLLGQPELHALRIRETGAANALLVNGSLLYPRAYFRTSHNPYEGLSVPVYPIDMSEAHKADGGLTCGSILIKRRPE